MGSQKVVSSVFVNSVTSKLFFYLPKMLQSLTLEILQPISSDLYDHYQSSVNHAGTGKSSKLRIKTKLDRTCQYSNIAYRDWSTQTSEHDHKRSVVVMILNKLLWSIVKFSTHAYGIFPFFYVYITAINWESLSLLWYISLSL